MAITDWNLPILPSKTGYYTRWSLLRGTRVCRIGTMMKIYPATATEGSGILHCLFILAKSPYVKRARNLSYSARRRRAWQLRARHQIAWLRRTCITQSPNWQKMQHRVSLEMRTRSCTLATKFIIYRTPATAVLRTFHDLFFQLIFCP